MTICRDITKRLGCSKNPAEAEKKRPEEKGGKPKIWYHGNHVKNVFQDGRMFTLIKYWSGV